MRKGFGFLIVLGVLLAITFIVLDAYASGYLANEMRAEAATWPATAVSARELIDAEKLQIVRDLSDKCEFQNKDASPYTIDHKDDGGVQVVFKDYQFYPPTIVDYMKQLRGVEVSLEEAVVLAMDDARAYDLAYQIIWEADGIDNWRNCALKLGLHARIDAIQEQEALLEKLSKI